uniref:Steroid 5-alpha reductase C-terminal domain-containing protein n=1 Tax=Gossypium raimondii TaxID=29730 RepID=A0A0D2QIS2_GOSRA|nr:hypothetical protein B456_007G004200 [Gossypium raimondii]
MLLLTTKCSISSLYLTDCGSCSICPYSVQLMLFVTVPLMCNIFSKLCFCDTMVIRILRWGEDKRYDRMRHNVGNLAVFFIFQGLWVWTVTLPVTVVNASDKDPSIQAEDIIGWIMWFLGTIVEILADKDKFSFKNSPESKGKWCEIGLWKYSRHPNYFGDILLTWGYFVASLPIIEGAEWLVLIGPVFLTLLLLFVSGLTILEKSGDKKFGNVEAYRVYKKRTSALIPLPRSIYGNLPYWFKAVFLFEFPIYNRYLNRNRTKLG